MSRNAITLGALEADEDSDVFETVQAGARDSSLAHVASDASGADSPGIDVVFEHESPMQMDVRPLDEAPSAQPSPPQLPATLEMEQHSDGPGPRSSSDLKPGSGGSAMQTPLVDDVEDAPSSVGMSAWIVDDEDGHTSGATPDAPDVRSLGGPVTGSRSSSDLTPGNGGSAMQTPLVDDVEDGPSSVGMGPWMDGPSSVGMGPWIVDDEDGHTRGATPDAPDVEHGGVPGTQIEEERGMGPEPEPEPELTESTQNVDNPLATPADIEAPPAENAPPPPGAPDQVSESSRGRGMPRRRVSPREEQVVQVTVPDDAYPGCRLEVQLPDGSALSVMVPEGAEAGSIIQAVIPNGSQTPPETPTQTEPDTIDTDDGDSMPPEPLELVDWELFSRRRQHLGIGLSVIGAVLLCLSVLHYMEYQQLLKEHEPDASFGCACGSETDCSPCTQEEQEDWAQRPTTGSSSTDAHGMEINAHCNPVCIAFVKYKELEEVRDLKESGDNMVNWGVLLCILATPLVLGMREFTKALIGSCCCCCIDMSTFLSQSETCSMLFIRILIINWSVVFISREEGGGYWQGCVFAGAILHLLFSLTAALMSRSTSRRAALLAAESAPADQSDATNAAAAANGDGDAAAEEVDVDERTPRPGPPDVDAPRSAPSLLRCGKCAEVFGLPPGTPTAAAARCPHCGTVNRQPPTFLEKHTRLQDRLHNLRVALQRQRRSRHGSKLRLRITRENVLADSFSHLRGVDGSLVASLPLSVQFDGEEGLDQGGVTREWMFLLMQAVLDPQVALFSTSNENYVYQINSSSHINPEHLDYFNFLGKLLAKCICDGITTPFSHFTPDVYNVLLQRPTYFSDLQVIDADIYRSLQWVLENNVEDLGLTFVADEEEFGMIHQIELKEGGKDIKVTEENKREFVELKAKYTMVDRKIEQLKALADGFNSVLALEHMAEFDASELELLLCGLPAIDLDDWKANVEYRSGYNPGHAVIKRFWQVVEEMGDDGKAKLLRFATGTSALPPGGFCELQGSEGIQRFCIIRVSWGEDRLPQAATCFNQIMLPPYANVETMRAKLELAINETGGFGLK